MKYLKCTIAGILAAVAFLLFFPLAVFIVMIPVTMGRDGFIGGIEITHLKVYSPYFWIVIGVAFAIGFSWEQRRLFKRSV